MPNLRVPALMKFYIEGQTEVLLHGLTVSDAISDLVTRYPAIKPHIMDNNGDLRRYINLFVNDTNIKDLNGLKTPIQDNDRIILLPSISGG
ncbi:MAG: MoaD family protein [Chloroflexi bacterium]|nr:MoaD family protein [Chloroflexota bacterium]